MPFSRSTFDTWPVSWADIEPHYRAVLAEVPLAGEEDDYAAAFPLLAARSALPPLAARTRRVLDRYARHRDAIRRRGVIVGKARLAFDAARCVRCGLCMTGCPYSLIYSSGHTFDRLIRAGRVRYLGDVLVTGVSEDPRPAVTGVDLRTGARVRLDADRVFIGAGAIGSTRIVLSSLPDPPDRVPLQESMQFLVPFLSRRTTGDPRRAPAQDFTLNQFNLLIQFDDRAYTTSQIHCYPYNPAVAGALPAILRGRAADRPAGALLGRLTTGFGYLPSWASPRHELVLERDRRQRLAEVSVRPVSSDSPMLRRVLTRLARVGPKLDLLPVLPMVAVSGPAKSYHVGSTFPHGSGSDLLGRVGPWRAVHLIDGAVLPSVPATTFMLTVMANAHRIATEALRG
jgi:ferredoxin